MIVVIIVIIVVLIFCCLVPFYRALEKRYHHWDDLEHDPRWDVENFQAAHISRLIICVEPHLKLGRPMLLQAWTLLDIECVVVAVLPDLAAAGPDCEREGLQQAERVQQWGDQQ